MWAFKFLKATEALPFFARTVRSSKFCSRWVPTAIWIFCSVVRSSAGSSGGFRVNTRLLLLALCWGRGGILDLAAVMARRHGGGVVGERELGSPVVLNVLLVVLLFVVEQGCASVEQIRFAAVFEGDVLFGAKFARRHTQWSEAGSAGHWSGRVTKNWALVWHVRLCSCILCRDIRSQTETTESMVLLEHGHRQLSLFSTE